MSELIRCRVNWLWRRNGDKLDIGDPVELTPQEVETYRPRGLVTPLAAEIDESDSDDDVLALIGTDNFDAIIELSEDRKVQLGDVVLEAHKRSGLSVSDWNALSQDERDAHLQAVVDEWFDNANPRGSDNFTAVIRLSEDKQVALGDVVLEAHKLSGLSIEDWNALTQDVRDEKLQAVVDDWRAKTKPSTEEELKFQERMRTICKAIAKLNPKKPKFWTKQKQPDLNELRKAASDLSITDAERDAAWEIYKAEHNKK